MFTNQLALATHGADLAVSVDPTARWRLRAFASWVDGDALDTDITDDAYPLSFGLNTEHEMGRGVRLLGHLAWRDALVTNSEIGARWDLDLHALWRIHPEIELGIHGRNLIEHDDPEFPGIAAGLPSIVERSVWIELHARQF